MAEMFERPKVSPSCLSAWQIARLALGELTEAELDRAQQHMEACFHCNGLATRESEQVQASTYERVPEELTAMQEKKPRGLFRWTWRPVGALAAVAAVALVVAVLPHEEEGSGIRFKGDLPVSLSVMRTGAIVIDEAPVEKIQDLVADDQIRLRVHAPVGSWVALQGWEKSAWVDYHLGVLAKEQWLPVGITITPEGETKLRVIVCKDRPAKDMFDDLVTQGTCHQRVFEL